MLIRLDKVEASEHIYNVVLKKNVPNGAFVELGKKVDYDAYEGKDIADVDGRVVMIVEPFIDMTGLEVEDEMVVKKDGRPARGYIFKENDEITITLNGVEGNTATVGQYLVPQVGKTALVASQTKAGSLCFEVVSDDEELLGKKAVLLRVVK